MSTKYIASNWRLPNKAGVDSYLNDNYGLTFDGISEYIQADNFTSLSGKSNFSISVWLKPKPVPAIGSGTTFQGNILNLTTSGVNSSTINVVIYRTSTSPNVYRLDVEVSSIAFRAEISDPTTDWTSLIITYNSNESTALDRCKVYQNGTQLTNTLAGNVQSVATADTLSIGLKHTKTNWFDHFYGSMSELAIYDYTLSESQISTLYGSSSLGAGNPMALKAAPVAFYPLGDNSSGNPLTQPNEAVEDASVFDFDGQDDFINTGTIALDGASTFTISCWIKTSNTAFQNLMGDNNLRYTISTSLNRLDLAFNGSIDFRSTNFTLNSNQWHSVITTFDGSLSQANRLKVYVDGVQVTNDLSGTTSTTLTASGNFAIGRRGSFSQKEWDGQISNVSMFDLALPATGTDSVETLYNSGVPLTGTQPQASNLKAWYKLDQSANWEADSSGAWQIPDAVSAYPQSFDFSGTNQNINLGNDASLYPGTSDISYSFWFKSNSLSSYKTIFSQGAADLNALSTGNKAVFITTLGDELRVFVGFGQSGSWAIDNGGAFNTSNANFVVNQWYHIVVTLDRDGDAVIYVNGVPNVTQAVNGSSTSVDIVGTDNSIIGGVAYDFDGQISNFQIWNTVLPETGTDSVETLYNNGRPLTTAIASDNLKAWYKLDNTATFSTNWSVPDASGNGNTGTSSGMTEQNLVNNNVSVLNGESSGMTSANLVLSDLTRNLPFDSYSFNFDAASSDYIEIADNSAFQITDNLTVSAWVYPVNKSATNTVVDKFFDGSDRAWNVRVQNSRFRINLSNASGSSSTGYQTNTALSNNAWHHLVFTFNSTTNEVNQYINGVLDSASPHTKTDLISVNTNPLRIGTGYNLLNFFDGKISNVSIFDEALTSTEVLKLYSNGMPQDLSTFTPSPIAWWTLGSNSFFNGSNFICKDLSGNGNDGTSVNAGVDALQGNTPRSEANGTGTNNSIPENLVGTTKYSSNNSWSINQSESARVQDTP